VNRDFASSLIQLNNTFYREHSASFSDTRQAPWPGWVRTMDIALEQLDVATIEHPVRVFDLACGNMRFENFAAGGALAAKGVDDANSSADASCPFEFYGVPCTVKNLSATAKSMPPILVRFLTTGGCGCI
jgi:hypothetical protein